MFDTRITCPATVMIIGPTSSGKTILLSRILRNRALLMSRQPEQLSRFIVPISS